MRAAARDFHYKKTGRYIPVVTDGGMTTGGDVCKAFASGADAVMIGSAFRARDRGARARLSLGHGDAARETCRGARASASASRARSSRSCFGRAFTEDGTLNLVGAIRTCMGSVGAQSIRELQQTELIIAPTIKTEGKVFQQAQKLGRPR